MSDAAFKIRERARQETFSVAWAVHDSRTGQYFGSDENESTTLAGAGRLVLLAAVLEAASAGEIELDESLTYEARHQSDAFSGVLRWLAPPIELSVRDALGQMIVTGDSIGQALMTEYLKAKIGISSDEVIERFASTGGIPVGKSEGQMVPDITMAPKGLLTLLHSLEAISSGRTSEVLRMTPEVAGGGLRLLRSAGSDGIAGLLPGYGPNLAECAHILCDGGMGGSKSSSWSDAGIVYQSGEPAYSLVVACNDVPEEVEGLPGPFLARRLISDIAYLLW